MIQLFVIVLTVLSAGVDASANKTQCYSLYPVTGNEMNKCTITFQNAIGGKIVMTLKFSQCKSEAFVHKKTSQPFTTEVSDFSKTFTQTDNIYKQTVNDKEISLKLLFTPIKKTGEIMIKEKGTSQDVDVKFQVVIGEEGKKDKVILSGLFLDEKNKCSWYSKLSDASQIGFVIGISLSACVVIAVLAIIIGQKLRKKYPGEKYMFSPYFSREPLDMKERSTTDTSRVGLLPSQN